MTLLIAPLFTAGIIIVGLQQASAGNDNEDPCKTPKPSVEPEMIDKTLQPGESVDVTKVFDPDEGDCEFEQVGEFEFGVDCNDSGFLDNIQFNAIQVEDDEWTETIKVKDDAEPNRYHCTIFWDLEYNDPEFGGFGEEVSQEIWITVPSASADLHVLKFNDLNANGEQDEGEDGIEGWEIWLVCTDNDGNALEIHKETNEDGMAWFEDIPAPNFCVVSEEQRPNWLATTPTSVTVELNPEDEKEVTFGNVRPLETEKFYTETEIDIEAGDFGVKLPFTDDGTQTVQAVIHPKTGKITSYNPGQYYAVTKVTAFVDLATVWIFEEDFLCTEGDKPISIWNPAKVPGGAYVAMMCPDGTTVDLTSELAHADPPQLFRNDLGVLEAHVDDVKAGCMVFLGVKYSPGLKGEIVQSVDQFSCENWEIVCANLTDGDNGIPNPDIYKDMIACATDVADSAHRVLEVLKCGENEEDILGADCVCKPGFVENPNGICVAAEL